jgi:hypothetical protein
MGKRIVLVTWRDVRFRPERVVEDVRRELRNGL